VREPFGCDEPVERDNAYSQEICGLAPREIRVHENSPEIKMSSEESSDDTRFAQRIAEKSARRSFFATRYADFSLISKFC
jgi:hypothetical protein